MTDSIVEKLQLLAIDPESDIEEILDKALFVASKLKIDDFKIWCKQEIDGYELAQVPEYRKFKGDLRFLEKSGALTSINLPSSVDELITSVNFSKSIGQLNSLLENKNPTFLAPLSNGQRQLIIEIEDNDISEPFIVLARYQLESVKKRVKSIILNWSLELEDKGILGQGLKFTEKEKGIAMSVNNYHIQNMQGVVGNVNESTINQNNQMNVYAKDFDSLARLLTENKVAFSDIQELKHALNADGVPTEPNRFGKNVSEWIGKMVVKATTGGWEISVATAGSLLSGAIGAYYGF
ncbi:MULTISPECIES: hypothetical protein [Acinetobacter]|uniref:AbiTii domain-containing protein n=1 Tax=Acinetobacter chengduensis TaxID=2420890 RepID=A0ABX9TZ78_9GAMM|nr:MULTISPECIES: hypothetical protein [Acinetobacter]MBI1450444.1 hypothetical protein [Acinetobacter sp. FL51]RKG44826.1 hypothetical protein D7V31_01095 [Acinetobacter sp. WCHAc060007]RLL23591.1 hypothetical protein D9K81_04220 [Acinetobacter chengduensis]